MEASVMSATVLAKKLQSRLRKLKEDHKAKARVYEQEYSAWLRAMVVWANKNLPKRILTLNKTDVYESRRFRDESFIPSDIWKGCPEPPQRPEDKQITAIQSSLRYLAITGQSKIKVSQADMTRWFGDEGEDE